MRTELEHIARIEKYLLNKMSSTEVLEIEQEMAKNPAFGQEIELQKQLVNRLYRHAMLAALNNAHTQWATPKWNLKKFLRSHLNAFFIVSCILGLGFIFWFFTSPVKSALTKPKIEKTTLTGLEIKNHALEKSQTDLNYALIDTIISEKVTDKNIINKPTNSINLVSNKTSNFESKAPFSVPNFQIPEPVKSRYKLGEENVIDPKLGASFIDAKTGTKISIKPNALLYANKKAINTPVKIIYTEYRSKGDMVLTDIPMQWFGKDSMPFFFHSEGMFSFLVDADSGQVIVNKSIIAPITVQFTPNNLTDSLNFFYLGASDSFWQFITKVEFENGKKSDSLLKNELNKVLKNPFSGELKTKWSEPKMLDDGVLRYGFWGRLMEYARFKTVYGDSTAAFSRVFFESKYITYKELGLYDKIALNRKGAEPVSAQNIIINNLGYYNYDKLMKSPNALRPSLNVFLRNEPEIQINKIVAVEEKNHAAYHFYNKNLCLRKSFQYHFFVFTSDARVLYCNKAKYAALENKSREIKLEFVDVTALIKSAADIDKLLIENEQNSASLK